MGTAGASRPAMDDRQPNDSPVDGRTTPDPLSADGSSTTEGRYDARAELTPPTPATAPAAPPPRVRRPGWSRLVGTGVALVVAFVWGGLAYRELGPQTTAYVPASVVSAAGATAVKGDEAPPAWVDGFAKAFCDADAKALADRMGPPLTGQVDQISQALSQRDWSCSDMRYIGGGTNPKGTFYVYLMRDDQSNAQEWWVFTTMDDKVIAIE